ncbi:lysophospholipid acyltransferase family protein [Calothrix sp. PCC 6303]|uniref:lysophospholipid acyltransferase family protein n=1 Tax=Calothrix sp. PCC 6303 TaxID=1170562 RepID=UPI0002A004F5|nr:1-acyl-sn-glycerol-3-phosphate acyltransferase [Calothrix sp. PCC 6303]AFZ00342.1 phospholipid/glycerol acyltransferase [Calothrix sp. PCC 6303]
MTSSLQYRPLPQTEQSQPLSFPYIEEATIKRAKEGVGFARDRQTNEMINTALLSLAAEVDGASSSKISGGIRRGIIRTLIHSLFRIKVEFPERVPNTPVIVVANHLNHLDPFFLLSELPSNPFLNILGDARTLYNTSWKRQILKLAKGVIPLERIWKEEVAVVEAAKNGRTDLADLAAEITAHVPKGNSIEGMRRLDRVIQATLNRGEAILLFPEGKLGKTEGKLLPLKRGAAIYAIRSGVPILPVALVGTHDLYFRKQITIRFGEPLVVSQSNRPKSQQVDDVLQQIQDAMVNILPQNYSEALGMKPFRRFLNHLFW